MATEAINARSVKWPPRQVQTYLDNALSLGTLQNTVCIHRSHPKENIYMAPGHAPVAMNYSHPSRRLKATSRAHSIRNEDARDLARTVRLKAMRVRDEARRLRRAARGITGGSFEHSAPARRGRGGGGGGREGW
ncbi:unnamed protein product [Euphydryas editha]|uniref:Uncharacterized protein n=1 Tax=Euphydryas editha TaxID=104508 RepID=A0AAU9UJZ2_EUPED|nr:unnamed protein product [Euphydryas editha]